MIPDDFFVHPGPRYPRHLRERVQAVWRNSQRFNFSPQASSVAGKLAFEAPELVINHRQFAIAPYPTTYVEMDSRAFFNVADPVGSALLANDETRDLRVGYLIDGDCVYTFASASHRGADSALAPFMYRMASPGETAATKSGSAVVTFGDTEFRNQHRMAASDPRHKRGKLALLLGTAASTTAAQIAQDDIVRAHEIEALLPMVGTDMKGWWGDMRNLWTLLLWLNQPARCRFTDVPPSRRITRGKLHTYTAFRTVEIELGKVRSIRRAYLLGAPRTPPRDHPVRGNFHHHGGLTQGCGHEWPLEPDVHGVWECQKCQRRRWWVKSHRRGDESRGTVVHDYAIVTPDEEKETPDVVHAS